MPTLNSKKEEKRPRKRREYEQNGFLQTRLWRKSRAQYLFSHPCCEIHASVGIMVDCTEKSPVDHIIPRAHGGSETDPRNFMTMTKEMHWYKNSLEAYGPMVPPAPGSEYGSYYPTLEDREKVIQTLARIL